jgi:hypothetical protein
LLSNLTIYAPLGIVVWSKHFIESGLQHRGPKEAIFVGLYTAFLFETSKLWLLDKHPDYTNALIAMAAVVGTYHLTGWIGRARECLKYHDAEATRTHIGWPSYVSQEAHEAQDQDAPWSSKTPATTELSKLPRDLDQSLKNVK